VVLDQKVGETFGTVAAGERDHEDCWLFAVGYSLWFGHEYGGRCAGGTAHSQ
jgi:hypothetical protein